MTLATVNNRLFFRAPDSAISLFVPFAFPSVTWEAGFLLHVLRHPHPI
jgi:hypothetical protein